MPADLHEYPIEVDGIARAATAGYGRRSYPIYKTVVDVLHGEDDRFPDLFGLATRR